MAQEFLNGAGVFEWKGPYGFPHKPQKKKEVKQANILN